jgi:hypothetical protein
MEKKKDEEEKNRKIKQKLTEWKRAREGKKEKKKDEEEKKGTRKINERQQEAK